MLRRLATATGVCWAVRGLAHRPDESKSAPNASFVQRCGSTLCGDHDQSALRFAGPNIYWLGLDENSPPGTIAYPSDFRIDDALYTAAAMGATVVRSHTLGISVGNPLSFEPSLGIFVDSALQSADFAIATAQALGLRLQIPLTDNYHYYHGGKHTFTDWLGLTNETEFYTNPQAVAAFKHYIYRRLTHVNAYTGLTAAEDPTIMMWETGNELDAPADWTADIASYIKSIAPHQLVMDGNYGIDSAALGIPQVDAYSDHFYPVDAARLQADIAAVSSAGKVLVVGEFGWTSGDVAGFLQQIEAAAGCVAYDLYWSLFPHADSFGFEQHDDGFSVHWPGDTPAMAAAVALLTGHAINMSQPNAPLPPSVPQTPLIDALRCSVGNNVTMTWRGAAGAAVYSVEASANASGPWELLCDRCVSDNQLPVNVSLPQLCEAGTFARVRGANLQGAYGGYSPVQAIGAA